MGEFGGARSLVLRQSESRDVLSISGVLNCCMLLCMVEENILNTFPAWHLPARPFLCVAEVREIHSDLRMLVLVSESNDFIFTLPVSTT